MFSSKKAMELSVNMVVMLIIGILLFGLGMGLFAKISASAEDEIRKMNDDVRTGISALECNTDDWICAPTMALDAGEDALFRVYMTNKNNQADEFKISISGVSGPDYELSSDDCGHISIYAANVFAAVGAEDSASFPLKIYADGVTGNQCDFITTLILESKRTGKQYKTSMVVSVG